MKISEIINEAELITSPTRGDSSGQSARYRKGIDKKTGKEWYQYNKQGHWGRKHSTEQSARDDAQRKWAAAGGQPYAGRSPSMDHMVQKMMPHRKKYGVSASDVATMAQVASGGGSMDDWKKRYGNKTPTQKPKPRTVTHQSKKSTYGLASEIQD